ncbi:MAG TPA: hypothetical protein VKU00_25190 [Chthonomonadaceae bacterium]|nr:hypothetical protein [Chthonomonadaceae bacterium]
METELTLGDIYEEISERMAQARTKALMGEREEALGLFHGASLDYMRFREVLKDYPGYHALEHAFLVTLGALGSEQESDVEAKEHTLNAPPVIKSRRKTRKAA